MWKWQSMFGMYVYSVENIKKQGFALNFMMLTEPLSEAHPVCDDVYDSANLLHVEFIGTSY